MKSSICGDDSSMDAARAMVTADSHFVQHVDFRTSVDDRIGVVGLNYLNI